MNEIQAADASLNPAIRDLMGREETEKEDDKNVFLKLMITQMQNQDPLNPTEGGEFLAQLAQFSTVEGIEKLNLSMDSMAGSLRSNQALQATAMVGRSVQVSTEFGTLTPDRGLRGSVDLGTSTPNLRLDIFSPTGQLVQQVNMGSMPAGKVPFAWNGYDNAGNPQPLGTYRVKAYAQIDGETEQVGTLLDANVDSVTINNDGSMTLNVAGVGRVNFEDITEIR